jgi:O-succinylbenzoate synthase
LGAADVLIVKPTITGSYDEIKKIVKLANKEGLRVVVTSSFETSIAQKYILNIISALQVSEYCGVFNIKLFEDDILPAFIKSNYNINQI